jgi:hypothetical protein
MTGGAGGCAPAHGVFALQRRDSKARSMSVRSKPGLARWLPAFLPMAHASAPAGNRFVAKAQRILATPSITRNVVVRYADGKVVQGHTYNLDPRLPSFHLFLPDVVSGRGTEIWIKDLKAIFFVRSLTGDPGHVERKEADGAPPPGTRKVRVEFLDGEVLVGYTTLYDRRQLGFFFTPIDPTSNNVRVFAVFEAVKSLGFD